MHFYCLAIGPKDDEELEELMAPYNEQPDPQFLQFCAVDQEEEWETTTVKLIKLSSGQTKLPWDASFERPGYNFLSNKERYIYPPDSEKIEIPMKEYIPDYDRYMKEWCGYEFHEDQGAYGYYSNPNSFWDWYQVGGRWTGILSDYNPEDDKANQETCRVCHGSGSRDDELGRNARAKDPSYTCNGCQGKGTSVKWPTEWKPCGEDTLPAKVVLRILEANTDKIPYSYICSEGFFSKERFEDREFIENDGYVAGLLHLLRSVPEDTTVTVIDYHS